ncbi:hypothetical protein [Haliangium sp.]|uniref:hypothetical protein n=1 Tax=Haliangium sp. TaxID=2663208 RepID=UPI003D126F59
MTAPATVPIEDSGAAKGADRMLLSADGRWMMLEYRLGAELPLIVRLDRRGETEPAVARGLPAGPPSADGTVFYVEQEAADMRTILASPPAERRSHLRRLGAAERLLSLDGAYGAWPVGDGAVVMFGGPGDRVEVMLVAAGDKVAAGDGRVRTRREALAGLGYMAGVAVAGERLVLLFDPSSSVADPVRTDGLILVGLSTKDLSEAWRREAIKPEPMFTRPSLGASAGQVLLTSQTSAMVASFDLATGAPGPTASMPPGVGLVHFVYPAKPSEHPLLLWTKPRRKGSGRRGWHLLQVRGDRIASVADRPDELPPAAAAWDGDKALLAPYGPPRSRDHVDEWAPPFADYMKRLDGAGP